MSDLNKVRIGMCLLFAGIALVEFTFFRKGKRRYQPVIASLQLLIYLGLVIPIFLLVFPWNDIYPVLTCMLFVVFVQSALYYTILLPLLPLLRRWFSPEAISTLWLLPNFLYVLNYSFMDLPVPRFMVLVKPSLVKWLLLIWGIGAACVLSYFVIQHLLFKRQLLNSASAVTNPEILEQWKRLQVSILFDKKVDLPLLTSPNVVTPLSIGLSRYTIRVVLPDKPYTAEELELILRHELIHIAHGDSGLKLTMAVCAALCWFNPLLWLAMKQCAQDAELSCDQLVMEDCGQEESQRYARLILSSAGDERGFTTCLSADAKALRYRLRGIIQPRKSYRGGVLVALALFVLLYTSGSVGLAWESSTLREQVFDHQPPESRLNSVIWDDREENTVTATYYDWTDEAAITQYLGGLSLCRTGSMYDLSVEDGFLFQYRRPDGLTFYLVLGERYLTVSYNGCGENFKSSRTRYYLTEPVDTDQLLRWLTPKNLEEIP